MYQQQPYQQQQPVYYPYDSGSTSSSSSPYEEPSKSGVYGKQSGTHKFGSSVTQTGDNYDSENPVNYGGGGIDGDKLTADVSTSIRHAFVRKVYCILFLQLLYTFGFGLVFSLVKAARVWLQRYWWIALIFMIVGFVAIIVMSCKPDIGRRYPTNYVMLLLVTVCMSWTIALAGATSTSSAFAIAAGITAVVCLGLTIFAIQTRWDFTGCSVFVFVALLVLIVFGIICAIMRTHIMDIVYSSLGALLFSFILVYDTQQVVGGKHRKYQYSLDDYVFGALTLYIDVLNLFLMILSLTKSS
eukprot:GHVS01022666.1.p1 GENE.GHVS01022666.1~~GHVS01022666.1.p1  ORF type:complete len:299 (+),score=41.08 GHVS01022666.1:489-1385(+)